MPTVTYGESPVVSLAEKVLTDLGATTWTPPGGPAISCTFDRIYHVSEIVPTETSIKVFVMMVEESDEELADRGGSEDRTFVVDVGVLKVLVDRDEVDEFDALVNFVEALRTYYSLEENFTVTGSQKARCIKREKPVIYSPEEIDKNSRFFSVIRLTFAGWYQ
jgi:hypothetical protein